MDHEHYMQLAIEMAKLAASNDEVPVGAVVVQDGKVIGRGSNQPISQHDPSAHAEIVAIKDAANHLSNYRLVGCDLYVTLEPCVMCMGAIMHARIANLYFGASDPKTGACGSVINLASEQQLNHHTTANGGILKSQCAELLSSFFKAKRQRK